MKAGMNFEEHKAIKEKRIKKLKSKDKEKYIDEDSGLEIINNKKPKAKVTKVKSSEFRNNHKNFQYDYEEDLYEPNY
ncbi:MAG TPA: hypothetical protein VLM81_00125 [Peptostreptococcaceae bacterium]|jgi:hypothetical protein|nr:hypothetical protein [Peptostreptococcaceae bacterium]